MKPPPRRPAPGMTLIELLVGLVVGLFVAASCTALWAAQLREARSQLDEARLTQDLRAALDLMTRELRRAGYWDHAADPVAPGALAASGADRFAASNNPYAELLPATGTASAVGYRYAFEPAGGGGSAPASPFGYRLRAGTLEALLGSGGWQALTDPAVSTITRFAVAPSIRTVDLADACPGGCTAPADACPRQQIRSLDLEIEAHLPGNPRVSSQLRTRVLLRNPAVRGACSP